MLHANSPLLRLSFDTVIASREDLAVCLGLADEASPEDISSAFMNAVKYEAWLDLGCEPVEVSAPEAWQVRVWRGYDRCRIEVRRDGRGDWIWNGREVPASVVGFFQAQVMPNGEIWSRRPFRAWSSMAWAGTRDRRMRSKVDCFMAMVVVPTVARPTGIVVETVTIGAIGAASLYEVQPVALPLPCTGGALVRAVDTVMRRNAARWMRVERNPSAGLRLPPATSQREDSLAA